MRVLHVMASGERGGGADHLVGLLPALRERGVDVCALVGSAGPLSARLRSLQIPVDTIELMHSRVDFLAAYRLYKYIQNIAPSLVHFHGTRAAFYGAFVKPLTKVKTIYTAHGLAYRQKQQAVRHFLSLQAEHMACVTSDWVISVSRADLDDLCGRGWANPQRSAHIPNAVDRTRFGRISKHEARRTFGVSDEVRVVGTVARLVPQKGVADLIRATAGIPDVVLLIAGDGPLRGELEKLAKDLRAAVVFFGARDDVPEFLAALDVFVLPSHWEGEPIALLEAMAAGVPIVATATSGTCEILKHEETGLLVPVGGVGEISAMVGQILRDELLRERLSSAAIRMVVNRDYRLTAADLMLLYRSVFSL